MQDIPLTTDDSVFNEHVKAKSSEGCVRSNKFIKPSVLPDAKTFCLTGWKLRQVTSSIWDSQYPPRRLFLFSILEPLYLTSQNKINASPPVCSVPPAMSLSSQLISKLAKGFVLPSSVLSKIYIKIEEY